MKAEAIITGLDEGIIRGLKSRTFVTAGERAPACGVDTDRGSVIANEVKQSTTETLRIASGFAPRNDVHTAVRGLKSRTFVTAGERSVSCGHDAGVHPDGFVMDAHAFVMDASAFVMDAHAFVIDASGSVMDASAFVMDADGSVMDAHGFAVHPEGVADQVRNGGVDS